MTEKNKPRAGVYVGPIHKGRGMALARVTRWEWDGIEALSAKTGRSKERIVAMAIKAYLESNGITAPKLPPNRSTAIRIISLIGR